MSLFKDENLSFNLQQSPLPHIWWLQPVPTELQWQVRERQVDCRGPLSWSA